MRKSMLISSLCLLLAACDGSDSEGGEDPPVGGDLVLVTSFPDLSGFGGTSFMQTTSLEAGSVNNRDAIETTFYPYVFAHGDWVFTAPHIAGDTLMKYVVEDGVLAEAGQLTLESAAFASNVVVVSDSKAYVSLVQLGRIVIFNPATMERLGQIDVPAEFALVDDNPDPAVMRHHDGKLFVGLKQLENPSVARGGADMLVIDPTDDSIIDRTQDDRLDDVGRFGWADSMMVGAGGDLYVYCVGSGGFAPGLRHGFLRIRAGETTFDPDYVFDLTETVVEGVAGELVDYVDSMVLFEDAVYGVAQVPALASNPPDYVNDRAFQPVRIDLEAKTVTVLDFPPSNGYATKLAVQDGLVLFALSGAAGVGLFTYDPASGEVSAEPRLGTEGDPSWLVALQPR